jgi:Na+-transporting methylmalonyl-CoA/oxaloacetate decarboxylase gamma subunit
VLIFRGSALQIVIVLLVSLASVAAFMYFNPYIHEHDNHLAILSQWSITLILMAAMIIKIQAIDPNPENDKGLGVILILLNILIIAFAIATAFANSKETDELPVDPKSALGIAGDNDEGEDEGEEEDENGKKKKKKKRKSDKKDRTVSVFSIMNPLFGRPVSSSSSVNNEQQKQSQQNRHDDSDLGSEGEDDEDDRSLDSDDDNYEEMRKKRRQRKSNEEEEENADQDEEKQSSSSSAGRGGSRDSHNNSSSNNSANRSRSVLTRVFSARYKKSPVPGNNGLGSMDDRNMSTEGMELNTIYSPTVAQAQANQSNTNNNNYNSNITNHDGGTNQSSFARQPSQATQSRQFSRDVNTNLDSDDDEEQ